MNASKKITHLKLFSILGLLILSSCVGDLDTIPIDEDVVTAADRYLNSGLGAIEHSSLVFALRRVHEKKIESRADYVEFGL